MTSALRRYDRHVRDDRAAAAVEFALIVPLLLLLVFGIVDFARAYNARATITHAAREAVRVQALGGTDVTERAEAAASPLAVTVTPGPCEAGEPTTVTVSTDFEYITPVSAFMQWFGGTGTSDSALNATGVMRCGG